MLSCFYLKMIHFVPFTKQNLLLNDGYNTALIFIDQLLELAIFQIATMIKSTVHYICSFLGQIHIGTLLVATATIYIERIISNMNLRRIDCQIE